MSILNAKNYRLDVYFLVIITGHTDIDWALQWYRKDIQNNINHTCLCHI